MTQSCILQEYTVTGPGGGVYPTRLYHKFSWGALNIHSPFKTKSKYGGVGGISRWAAMVTHSLSRKRPLNPGAKVMRESAQGALSLGRSSCRAA